MEPLWMLFTQTEDVPRKTSKSTQTGLSACPLTICKSERLKRPTLSGKDIAAEPAWSPHPI